MSDSSTSSCPVVWLTGASGGLGPGIASMLAAAGFALALHTRSRSSRFEEQVAQLRESTCEVIVTEGDLVDHGVPEAAVTRITGSFGRIDALVHLAGPYVRKSIADHSRAEFDEMLSGNLTSFFATVQAALPFLRHSRRGRILAMGMAGAQHTSPMIEHGPHLAAKAGLTALARTLALELAADGVTVNVINPGHILHKQRSRLEARATSAGPDHPMGVHGSYEDIGDAILYLLSENASYVTGSVLDVGGGWRSLTPLSLPRSPDEAEQD